MAGVMARFDLTGRVALVTGATRGLGEAFAVALAEAGADIVIGGRDEAGARAVQAQVEERGRRAVISLGDITRRENAERLFRHGLEAYGSIDVLVNNAGTCIHRPALEVTDEEWRQVMGLNLDAVWMMSQIAGAHMVERRQGSIINIGSMSGEIVNRPQWQPGYNASKAAVHHLTKSLAAEWGPFGVRVNALAPGYMKTAMAPVDRPEFRRYWIEDAALERYGYPEELGGAVVFLASDASTFVTGSVLVVDGGYTVF